MAKSSAQLRAMATRCLERARNGHPDAATLRHVARVLRRDALTADLLAHGRSVGRSNVTIASFREYLRTTTRDR